MVGVLANLGLMGVYQEFLSVLPFWTQQFINLFFISIVIVIYAFFIWKFYKWVSKKDILELNLNKYNRSQHPFFAKWVAGILYFVEYLIILPLVVFVWFIGFTLFLMLLSESIELNVILIISATILTAIRMTAYYNEDLSQDLAKLLPLTFLGAALTQFQAFSFENVLSQIPQIPQFFQHILIYLMFIIVIEFFLRVLDVLFIASGIEEVPELED